MKELIVGKRGIILAAILIVASAAAAFADERIQLAILLDTSNSMDGLIGQAKSQLWKVVNELARSKRAGKHPTLEVALFEYGNDGLPESAGYLRMVSNLTTDLDKISEALFRLTTDGGSEYCGMVIEKAVEKLSWSGAKDALKIIYIAGNEPFTQGPVSYAQSCAAAIRKGIQVNTIFCGSNQEGIDTAWRDGAVRADGKYMSIDQDEVVAAVATPYDDEIVKLGNELNTTYIGYGKKGESLKTRQAAQDSNAAGMGQEATVQRSVAKAQAVYSNAGWDLVDAVANKTVDVDKLKDEELPAEMKKMTVPQREKYVASLSAKRAELQAKINDANEKRRQYVAKEMEKSSTRNTLDTAILTAAREQASKKGFTLE
jgi:hypothetical protein